MSVRLGCYITACAIMPFMLWSCDRANGACGTGDGGNGGVASGFAIGQASEDFVDAARSNRRVNARIYYPAVTAGCDTPLAGGDGEMFPVVVFGHGYQISIDRYAYLWQGIVPQGYIVVLCNTETGIVPSHARFGEDLAFLAEAMLAAGADPASRFHGRIASRTAVLGHSMGGGAAFLSVQHSKNIATIATLAAADTSPSAITAASSIDIPTLLISGSEDHVTPPAEHQLPMYQALPSSCKYLVTIDKGSHCQFAQGSLLCDAAEATTCLCCSYLNDAKQKALTLEFLLPWFRYTLKGDASGLAQCQQAILDETAAGTISTLGDCGS